MYIKDIMRENTKNRPTGEEKRRRNKPFLIVAIGASAGGLEAVVELLSNLPPRTGMAYIYIQHLDPTYESKIVPILSKVTKMKVLEAKHLMRVVPDQLIVIPPNKDMAIIDGVVTLNPRPARPAIHMPVDKLFSSLAEKQKEAAIGIILSGSANDGTFGLKAIKTAGGLTFAQDESAKFQSMPRSAIAEDVVDMVLSPKEIAEELAQISNKTEFFQAAMEENEEEANAVMNEDMTLILQQVKKGTSVDFTHYKVNTIRRRIIRRMLLFKLDTLKEYAVYLRQHPDEVSHLYQDLLINVTTFFRDPDSLEYLKKTLLPGILKTKNETNPLRIWVPACSTGEEAYSLAIILMEILGERYTSVPIQIFATDLSELAIAKARLGLYSRHDLVNVSPKRLQLFFTKIDGSYRISKAIRDIVVFAPHNVFKDPPFSRLDLVSCCNIMIYLDTILQKKIIATFHYALNNKGYLILGKSETIGASAQLFTQIEKKFKIYARKNDAASKAIFEMNYRLPDVYRNEHLQPRRNVNREQAIPQKDLEKVVDELLLSKYIPATVLVNQELEILQFRGDVSAFLEPAQGKASLNLLKMANQGLAFELRSAVHKVNKTSQPFKKSGLEIRTKNGLQQVSIEVLPLLAETDEKLCVIVFEDLHADMELIESSRASSKDKMVKRLQDELAALKEDMRSIIEEQEASNEELQSANEEIVSTNEELQSINEELETSKEEVESSNEELMTINTELQIRNEQLAESYEYAEAVFDTIQEAVILLDKDLRIKTANKAFYSIFQAREETTEGILIYELGHRQWDIPALRDLLQETIPNESQFQNREIRHTFAGIGEKVLLLSGRRIIQKIHRQQLILLAIQDITEHKQAQRLIIEQEAWFRNMADNAPVMIWVADRNKQRKFFNRTWLEYTGKRLDTEAGDGWKNSVHEADRDRCVNTYNTYFDDRKPYVLDYRLLRADGIYRWIQETGKPDFSADGNFEGYIGSCIENHDKRMMHDELEQLVKRRTHDLEEINKELQRSNSELKQFAYVASHDLQEPLRKIMTFADRLQSHKDNLPEAQRKYIDKIGISSQRMTRLIDDLLNFSRTARYNNGFTKTSLNKVVKDMLVDFDLIISQKHAAIDIGKLPSLQAIPLQMEQLFHNLISNALKFTKSSVVPVIKINSREITAEEVAMHEELQPDLKYHEVIVADNGIGIESEFAEQIFEIFQRLNDREQFPGTGIGLALCRKIVNNHNGIIFAKSLENEGTAFHIILPVTQPLDK
jgi:two-component system CheB/CheR fusion protein